MYDVWRLYAGYAITAEGLKPIELNSVYLSVAIYPSIWWVKNCYMFKFTVY